MAVLKIALETQLHSSSFHLSDQGWQTEPVMCTSANGTYREVAKAFNGASTITIDIQSSSNALDGTYEVSQHFNTSLMLQPLEGPAGRPIKKPSHFGIDKLP